MREPFYSENDWKKDGREMDRLQELEDLEMKGDGMKVSRETISERRVPRFLEEGKMAKEKKIWVKVKMLKNHGMTDDGPVYEEGQVVEIVDFIAEGWMKRGICEQVS